MTEPTGAFIWYELMTTNSDAATAFYNEVVGWKIGPPTPPEMSGGADYRLIVRSDGGNTGGVLQLIDDMISHGARPCWVGYIQVDDVDAEVSAIRDEGGTVFMAGMDLPVGRMAMVSDPQGAPFYVMKPVPMEDTPDGESDSFDQVKPQHVRWNELMTSDPDAATEFYTSHFGWTQEGDMDMGPIGKYRFIQHGGVAIGAIMPQMPEAPFTAWTHYIGVDDIDRAIAAVEAGGGKIVNGPMEIPGGEFSLNGVDPQGALFGLVGPRKDQ